jgi:N-acetyl-anhydromuramyl-L-alanine amidase AmpD
MSGKTYYGFGDLNPFEERPYDLQRENKARDLSPVDALSSMARTGYEKNIFEGSGTQFRAVVLRVEPSSTFLPINAGFLARAISLFTGNSFVQLKARIPELHACLPDPNEYGSREGTHQSIIELYPTFIAQNNNLPKPAVGDLIWVTFGQIETQTDPIYLGPVNDVGHAEGGTVYSSPTKSPFSGCVKDIKDFPSSADFVYKSALFNEKNYRSEYVLRISGNETKVPFPTRNEIENAMRDFGFQNRKDKIKKIIVHHSAGSKGTWQETYNILKQRRLGTHFEIDKEGLVVQYIDPALYMTWHAGKFNSDSIGIDMSGPSPKMTDVQIRNTVDLILFLTSMFDIPFNIEDYKLISNVSKDAPNEEFQPYFDLAGVFAHRHLTTSGKPDPYSPREYDAKSSGRLWATLKDEILKGKQFQIMVPETTFVSERTIVPVSTPSEEAEKPSDSCVSRLGDMA